MADLLLPPARRLHRIGDRTHDGWTPVRNLGIGGNHRDGRREHGWYLNPQGGLSEASWHQGRMALIAATRAFVWVERVTQPSGRVGLHVRMPRGGPRLSGAYQVPFEEPIPTRTAVSDFGMNTTRAYRDRRHGGIAGGLPVAQVLQQWQLLELAMARPDVAQPTLFEGQTARDLGLEA